MYVDAHITHVTPCTIKLGTMGPRSQVPFSVKTPGLKVYQHFAVGTFLGVAVEEEAFQ